MLYAPSLINIHNNSDNSNTGRISPIIKSYINETSLDNNSTTNINRDDTINRSTDDLLCN